MNPQFKNLPYNPEALPRELKKYYLSATDEDIHEMLNCLGLKSLDDLYNHIPENVRFKETPNITSELSYEEILKHLVEISKKNSIKTSFIGDGLKNYKVPFTTEFVSNLRGLTTAYTPYQPERGQGTLMSLWIYSSTLSMLTGFEAVNASMYDRSTALFEAMNTSLKLVRNSDTVLVCESIYPQDLHVLCTMSRDLKIKILPIPLDKKTGRTDIDALKKLLQENKGKVASISFPQVNSLGILEDVNTITDICHEEKIQAIGIIDPMLLSTNGLLKPSLWGTKKLGAHMIVGEGQHLCMAPNFGGPGLGIFGIRFNDQNKNAIRSTPGRYVGKGKDKEQNTAWAMVLSTREQHIRREKATSNICSNQAFIASLAGAGILARGETGMSAAIKKARDNALKVAKVLSSLESVDLSFPESAFYNEFVINTPMKAQDLIQKARHAGIHLGVDVSARLKDQLGNHLLLSFFDLHNDCDLEQLISFFTSIFPVKQKEKMIPELPDSLIGKDAINLPNLSEKEIKDFYQKLNDLNVSPDDNIYPLGSCTMKYNPYINDYVASLPGFTDIHPQAPIEDAQGSLEILYQIQEMFKNMTGLKGVATQPVAGAHGEYTGIKMFQEYHRKNKEENSRNILLIPHSAHGTNPATASMAGFETKVVDGVKYGIVLLEANNHGQIDMNQFKDLVKKHDRHIAGIMVTNPNTSGIFETNFKEIADLIHSVGGLVYMDGANMNAIAAQIDLSKMGVDAIHNNLHKTWSISHGGGGPGDAIVAVSEKLVDFIPGIQVIKDGNQYKLSKPVHSIGELHRHFGNFAHKIRCYAYLKALGSEGVKKMSAVAVLSARYLYHKLSKVYPTLPLNSENEPRMHEFILTISKETFEKLEKAGTPHAQAIVKIGKLFLDFGVHAPTVAFPEVYGLMVEPTESYSKKELDKFAEMLVTIKNILEENPEVLTTTPHFTPVLKVDEVEANKTLILSEKLTGLPPVPQNRVTPLKLANMELKEVYQKILEAHKGAKV